MTTDSCARWLEWIDLEVDGALDTSAHDELGAHLVACGSCRAERDGLVAVHGALAAGAVVVDRGFSARVLAELPAAPWEARNARAWALPALLALGLAAGAGFVVAGSAGELSPHARFVPAASALFDLFSASLLAGFGLAAASWKGLGLGVADWLAQSSWNWIAAAIAVGGANYALYRLVSSAGRRRGALARAVGARDRRG